MISKEVIQSQKVLLCSEDDYGIGILYSCHPLLVCEGVMDIWIYGYQGTKPASLNCLFGCDAQNSYLQMDTAIGHFAAAMSKLDGFWPYQKSTVGVASFLNELTSLATMNYTHSTIHISHSKQTRLHSIVHRDCLDESHPVGIEEQARVCPTGIFSFSSILPSTRIGKVPLVPL